MYVAYLGVRCSINHLSLWCGMGLVLLQDAQVKVEGKTMKSMMCNSTWQSYYHNKNCIINRNEQCSSVRTTFPHRCCWFHTQFLQIYWVYSGANKYIDLSEGRRIALILISWIFHIYCIILLVILQISQLDNRICWHDQFQS